LQVVLENGKEALESSQFHNLPVDFVQEILGSDYLQVDNEMTVFHAALAWTNAECKRKSLAITQQNTCAVVKDLLMLVRFPLMVQSVVYILCLLVY